jgi:hypothetical protein
MFDGFKTEESDAVQPSSRQSSLIEEVQRDVDLGNKPLHFSFGTKVLFKALQQLLSFINLLRQRHRLLSRIVRDSTQRGS